MSGGPHRDKERQKNYYRWYSMVLRCTNPDHPDWGNYGGRGIGVCDRWLNSFETFHADLGCPPAGMSLDRIDNDGDYCPENVRWADARTQSWNKRNPAGARTHCPQNHPYDEVNTYITPTGHRDCRTCRRDAGRRARERARAKRSAA